MMKRVVAILGLSLASLHAQADCGPKDFDVEDFKVSVPHKTGGRQRFTLSGNLINHCSEPAAAQIRVIARDANGRDIKFEDGWPAGSNNIAPGQSVSFDFGPLFKYDPRIDQFAIAIAETKTW